MNDLVIKQLAETDLKLLRELSIETFINTYAHYNTEEDMKLYVMEHFGKEQLKREIQSVNNFYFGIFDNNILAGYTKLRTTENPEELSGKKHIELERIYAAKNYQGIGVGYKLMQYSLQFAAENNFEILWLGVWEKNEKALRFYEKCGFEIFGRHIFTLGTDEQIDWLMKKELNHLE